MPQVLCDICKDPKRMIRVDANGADPGTHQYRSGYVKIRDAGGGHGLSLATNHARWAHGDCVARLSAGYDVNQTTMFDE